MISWGLFARNLGLMEKRPHLQRACPFPGCDWIQTTSWFMGGPDLMQSVNPAYLMAEAESHFLTDHFTVPPQIFT